MLDTPEIHLSQARHMMPFNTAASPLIGQVTLMRYPHSQVHCTRTVAATVRKISVALQAPQSLENIIPKEPNQSKLHFPKQKWYEQFPWLHYLQEEDSVLCFYCATAVQRKTPLTGYIDKTFTETGFNNWQKALSKFKKHEH